MYVLWNDFGVKGDQLSVDFLCSLRVDSRAISMLVDIGLDTRVLTIPSEESILDLMEVPHGSCLPVIEGDLVSTEDRWWDEISMSPDSLSHIQFEFLETRIYNAS